MENRRIETKQFLILKIGRIANKINPNYYNEITDKEIDELKKKSREELKVLIKELKKIQGVPNRITKQRVS